MIRARRRASARHDLCLPAMRPLVFLAFAALLASCRDPRAEANVAEAMIQVGTEISALRQDVAVMQEQIDSLRLVAAHQDTVIARLTTAVNLGAAAR